MDASDFKAKGNKEFAAGDYAAAIASYTDAIQLLDGMQDPADLHLLYGNRAAAALKLGRFAAALQDSEAALAVQPGWAKALYRKAAALQGLGQLAAAAAAAQQALQAEPGSREVRGLKERLLKAQAQAETHAAEKLAAEAAAGGAGAAGAGAAAGALPAEVEADGRAAGGRRRPPTAAVLPRLLGRVPWQYVPAAGGQLGENLLLLLHGLGDRPAAFAALARRMALPQTAALALGGPQEVPFSDGGRSWYTVFTPDFELIEGRPGEQRRIRSLAEAVGALQQLLTSLHSQCGYQPRCVHLLGFSQGGTVALELARQQQACGQPLGSCVAVSASLLPEQLPELRRQQQQRPEEQQQQQGGVGAGGGSSSATPVLITRGTLDRVVSQQAVEGTAEVLRSVHGMAVDVHSVPGKPHAMPRGEAEMQRLMQFWAQRLSRRPTAVDLPPGVAGGEGELLEVRPGEVSIELVGPGDA